MSLSYRDEIPPVVGKNPEPKLFSFDSFSRRTWIFIGLGVAAVIVAFVLLLFSGGSDLNPQMQRLTARMQSLHDISSDVHDNIQNSDLRKINSDVRILSIGGVNRLREPFTNAGMGEVSGSIQAAEEDLTSQEELEEARLMGTFDTTYVRFLDAKIDTILPLLTEIYDNTNNPEVRAALEQTFNDFTHLKQLVADLEL